MTISGAEFDAVHAAWSEVLHTETSRADAQVADWQHVVARLAAKEAEIRSEGRWTSGPSELMAILGVHHDEVRNCRVLRWLLDPEGAHGLGDRMLRRLLGRLPIEPPSQRAVSAATVQVEVSRGVHAPTTAELLVPTRADVVIEVGAQTVVIEAKTFAGEGLHQCHRLELAWGPETHLVFLTRRGTPPTSAGDLERWVTLRWSDVAEDLDASLAETSSVVASNGRPAALEYLRTLRSHLS